jgi:hypothetical protein
LGLGLGLWFRSSIPTHNRYFNQYTGPNSRGCSYTEGIVANLLAGTYSSSNSNDSTGGTTTTHSSLDDLSDMILEHEYTETEWDVILGVTGLVLGMCLVCCLCGQKVVKRHRKKQQAKQQQMLVDGGDGTQPGGPEIPVSRKQSIKEMVKTAAAGTKLVVKEAASKAASIVRGDKNKNKKNSSTIDDDEGELDGGYVDVGDSTNEVTNKLTE